MQAEEEAGANDPETPQPPPPVPSLSAEPTVEAAVGKCARFFKTLMHLTQSSYHTLATATAVRQIVRVGSFTLASRASDSEYVVKCNTKNVHV